MLKLSQGCSSSNGSLRSSRTFSSSRSALAQGKPLSIVPPSSHGAEHPLNLSAMVLTRAPFNRTSAREEKKRDEPSTASARLSRAHASSALLLERAWQSTSVVTRDAWELEKQEGAELKAWSLRGERPTTSGRERRPQPGQSG